MLHRTRILVIGLVAALALLGVGGLGRPMTALAATCTVTTLADSGGGLLRDRLNDANCDTITFGVTGTITLISAQLEIRRSVTITGPGMDKLTVSGNNAYTVFSSYRNPCGV